MINNAKFISNKKIYFISFADSRMQNSLNRIKQQAKDINCYDYISVYTEKDLNVDFIKHFKDKLIFGSRGFGYWCWKPILLVILLAVNNLDYPHKLYLLMYK